MLCTRCVEYEYVPRCAAPVQRRETAFDPLQIRAWNCYEVVAFETKADVAFARVYTIDERDFFVVALPLKLVSLFF